MVKNAEQEQEELDATKADQLAQVRADLEQISDDSEQNLPIEAKANVEVDKVRIKFTFLSQSYTAVQILTDKGYVLQQQTANPHEYNVITFPPQGRSV